MSGGEPSGSSELVAACTIGDEDAWSELIDRFNPLVWSVLRSFRLTITDTEDAMQATWVRVWRKLPELRDSTALPHWLAVIARREAMRTLRGDRGTVVSADVLPEAKDEAGCVESAVLSRERMDSLRMAVGQLGARDQLLVSLLAAGRSYRQIAETLEVSETSVGPLRTRCLARLRRRLRSLEGLASLEPESRALGAAHSAARS